MVSLWRLNLFVRLVHEGSDDLKRVVFAATMAANSRLRAVERDLAWMSMLLPELAMTSTEQWTNAINIDPMLYKRKFKKAAEEIGANQLEGAFDFPVAHERGEPLQCRTCDATFP